MKKEALLGRTNLFYRNPFRYYLPRVRLCLLPTDISALYCNSPHLFYFIVYTPVPYQENEGDGGVFVCRYAYNLYTMRHLKFTWVDIMEHFKSMITRGPAFQFDMEDIARIRGEIGTLINKLSEIYLAMKLEEKKEKKKSKSQAMKSLEEEKQSDIGNEDGPTSAPRKSDTPSDSSTVLEGRQPAGEVMDGGADVAGDGDASDAKMSPSEEKENVLQEGVVEGHI